MKRGVLFLLLIILALGNLAAQELHFSIGPEFGFGLYKTNFDNVILHMKGAEIRSRLDTNSIFFAPGLNLSIRYFARSDNTYTHPITYPYGLFFRSRLLLLTNSQTTGTGSANGITLPPIKEIYSIGGDNSVTTISDFALGLANRLVVSEKWQLHADLGFNFTVMYSEDFATGDTDSYLGFGIISALSLQTNLTKTMFLEFGFKVIGNIISSTETMYLDETEYRRYKYEDTGRWDFFSLSAFVGIGWRFDVKWVSP